MQGTITLTNGQQLSIDGLMLDNKPHRSITALLKEVKQLIHDNCQHDCNTAWNQAKQSTATLLLTARATIVSLMACRLTHDHHKALINTLVIRSRPARTLASKSLMLKNYRQKSHWLLLIVY